MVFKFTSDITVCIHPISFLQDVLVNVTDLSHPQFHAQRANVQHVLEQLRLSHGQLNAMITVLNKADKVYVATYHTAAAPLRINAYLSKLPSSQGLSRYFKKI